jgi:hypothetical protein
MGGISMDAAMLNRFLEKLAESPDMLKEFVELAARHGIDLSAGELSGSELDAVAGGLATPDPQRLLLTQQATQQSLSNISRLMRNLSRSTILNMR